MSKELCYQVGEIGQDNLIAKLYPPAQTTGVTLRAADKETILPRGTVLSVSSTDGLLVQLGTEAAAADPDTTGSTAETLTAAYILCDDTTVGTENTPTVAYRAGCFNADALTVADGYTITAADEDALRKYGIILHHNML